MELNIKATGASDAKNILDIAIPESMRVRHKCGIDWIDDALAGGFVATQAIMFTGNPGAGKTTLVLQLADSLTAQGHVVLYNTREEALVNIALKMEQLSLKTGFYPAEEQRWPELKARAEKLIAENPKKQFFLIQDSLPTLDDGFYKDGAMNGKTPERACMRLTEWAKEKGVVVIFINHVTKDGQFVGKNTVKHAIDTHMHVRIDKKTGYRHFSVEKNRFGANYDTYVVTLGKAGITLVRKISLVANQETQEQESAAIEAAESENTSNIIDDEPHGRRRGRRAVRLG